MPTQDTPPVNAATNRLMMGFGYDNAGNVTSDGQGNTFTYDGENRQTTHNNSVSGLTQYSYDGDGQRVKKQNGTNITIFAYNASGQLVAEYTTEGPQGSGTSYLTSDHLGSTRVVTAQNQSVKSRRDYCPFGEEIGAGIGSRTAVMGYSQIDGIRQQFTGKERDAETGLDYFLTRYLSSVLGRFTSPDSVSGRAENPQSLNLYTYVMNNPLRYVDPLGQSARNITESEYDGTEEKEREQNDDPPLQDDPPPVLLPRPLLTPEQIIGLLPLIEDGIETYKDLRSLITDNFYVPTPLDDAVAMVNNLIRAFAGERAGCDDTPFIIIIDADKYPLVADHIEESVENGHPRMLTLDRPRVKARRAENMKRSGLSSNSLNDRDEYPPAIFEEAVGSSVRYIPFLENRGAGSQQRWQIHKSGIKDGNKVMYFTTRSLHKLLQNQ